MKHLTYLFAVLVLGLSTSSIYAQAPNWQWAKQYGTSNQEYGSSVATDAAGNVYMTGSFSGSIGFGTDTLISAGLDDIFIIKYDAAGNILWVKRYGGTGSESSFDIIVNGSGDIYISGQYNGTSPFGVPNANNQDKVFIAKLDNSGNLLWNRYDAGSQSFKISCISIDRSGNVLIGGFTNGVLIFGADTINTSRTNTPFIVKYNSNGDLKWVRALYCDGYAGVWGISVDKDEDVYITGPYHDTIKFDTIRLVHGDIFAARYNKDGIAIWAKNIKAYSYSYGSGIAIDDHKNVFVAGDYFDSAKFDNVKIVSNFHPLPSSFLAKYDSSGNIQWAKHISRSNYYDLIKVITDQSNNLYLNGVFTDSVKIGNTIYSLLNGGSAHYLQKLDNNGDALWGVIMPSQRTTPFYNICLSNNDEIYLTGSFRDSLQCGTRNFKSVGSSDIFIAKLSYQPNTINTIIPNESEVNIYPQPTSGLINIQFSSKEFQYLVITDQLGREVYHQSINSGSKKLELNLSQLSSGIYYIRFNGSNSAINRKILIQH